MRALRRFIDHQLAELGIAPRRRRLRGELGRHFGRPIRLGVSGARGRDSVYQVLGADSDEILGVVRLVNPRKRRKPPSPDQPFVWQEDAPRLAREWHAYRCGGPLGLTPQPLWRADDALLCSHIDRARLSDRLFADPSRFWELNAAASGALAALHACGVVHMDASLANTLGDADLTTLSFVDFEYAPAPDLNLAQQKAYDHLRLLESGIKFMPDAVAGGVSVYCERLDHCLDADTRHADLTRLEPAIGRLLAHPICRRALAAVFREHFARG